MRKLIQFPDLGRQLLCCVAAILAVPCLAQTVESAGAVTPADAASGSLGETNIWVIAALAIATIAIVLALIYRKKPSALVE